MALNYNKLMDIAAVATGAAASFLANPAATKTYIGSLIVHNTSASTTRVVTLYNVPGSGGSLGSASTANEQFKISVAANETVFLEPKYAWVLTATNDAFFGLADGSGVTIQALGTTDS